MRAAWRHEQLSVRMALAAAQHHSAPKCAGPETYVAPRGQTTARAAAGVQHFCLDLDDAPAAGGSRPDRLPEVRPQERIQRHTVDQIIDAPLLDVPVPQMEEQLLLDVFRLHDRQVPELVIEVPMIICEDIPTRSSVPEPQLVEQLVDVPTVLSVAVLQRRAAEAREEEMQALFAVPIQLRTPAQLARLRELVSASSQARRRKRKKRRKRRTPRTSSLPGRARRRQRQWHVSLRHLVDVPVVWFVLFPQVLFADWISSNDEICADDFIYFRFKLIGKGRSEQWEVFLYCDKTIKMTVIARKCCPGVCLRLALVVLASVRHPALTRSTLSSSSVCHPSVAASRCRAVVDFSLLVVLTILYGTE